MAPGGSTSHSDRNGPQTPTWTQLAAQTPAIAWPSMVSEAMDINTGPCCCKILDQDTVQGSIPGRDVTLVPGERQAANISQFLTDFKVLVSLIQYILIIFSLSQLF